MNQTVVGNGSSTPKADIQTKTNQSAIGGMNALAKFARNTSPIATAPAQAIIQEYTNFPDWVAVLSGSNASGGLNIPENLQDKVIAVRLTTGIAVLAYDPTYESETKAYLGVMRNELTNSSSGVSVSSKPLLVSSSVIEKLRTASDSKRTSNFGGNVADNSVTISLFKEWVMQAHRVGATDIHLRPFEGGRGEIMARIDGILEPLQGTLGGLTDINVIETMKAVYEQLAVAHSNSDSTFSAARTMSCMLDEKLGIPNLRMRFASQRGHHGPKAVMRLLRGDISGEPMSFEAMGFSPDQQYTFEIAQRMRSGIILQCGVTGSGKTTAAKTLLETHPKNGAGALYQIADPIEYLLKGVHQIYIQRNLLDGETVGKKDPYSECVESLLRMDPDLIDVGEIRDVVSARAAANIAKTGHLALGTLHVDSIQGLINRLTDPKMGLSRTELTSGRILGLLTMQSLVPKLCNECSLSSDEVMAYLAQSKEPNSAKELAYTKRITDLLERRFSIPVEVFRFRNHEGCPHCRNRGTTGLTIVSEMMIPDDQWLDHSSEGKDRFAWQQYRMRYSDRDLTSGNMQGKSMLEHAIYKAYAGIIDPRNIEDFGPLDLYEILSLDGSK